MEGETAVHEMVVGEMNQELQSLRERERQQKLKQKVHSLRHLMRQMRALHRKKWYGEMSWHEKRQYRKWRSGEMGEELQSLTLEHGYGYLPSDGNILLPTRFPDRLH